jgi:hypothetical protein
MTPAAPSPGAASRVVTGARGGVSREWLLAETDDLIAAGDALVAHPDWDGFRSWLIRSDVLLQRAWGPMDRYHLAWLNVGRDSAPPGSALDEAGTDRFIVEIARAKLAVLTTMRAAVARDASAASPDIDGEHG